MSRQPILGTVKPGDVLVSRRHSTGALTKWRVVRVTPAQVVAVMHDWPEREHKFWRETGHEVGSSASTFGRTLKVRPADDNDLIRYRCERAQAALASLKVNPSNIEQVEALLKP